LEALGVVAQGFATRILRPSDEDPLSAAPCDPRPLMDAELGPQNPWETEPGPGAFLNGAPSTRIMGTTAAPFRSICHLEIRYRDGREATGTAWFAGPDLLVTAGRNLMRWEPDATEGVPAERVRVIPGRFDASVAPLDIHYAESFEASPGWRASGRPEHDVGMIRLADSGVGGRLGWFGLAQFGDADLSRRPLAQSAGYPRRTRPYGTMWYDAARLDHRSAAYMAYPSDGDPGRVGAPVFFSDGSGRRWAVGLHVRNAAGAGLCRRITGDVFDWIEAHLR